VKKKNNQAEKKIRVMLVDDHSGMREALRKIINSNPDLTVVAEADGGRTALELVGRSKPDVILMDGSMPEMNGIEATRQLKQLNSGVRIIGLTLYEETTYLEEMVAAGASGYILKAGEPANVIKAIRAVAAGGTYFDKALPRRSSAGMQNRPLLRQLTADEMAVMKLLADGQTNVEIAADLKLALPVVERHRAAVMKKLGVRNRAELVRLNV
jgi:DNA-binding NarL/FixJ family response regulator